MKTASFDKKFDSGKEDITQLLDLSKAIGVTMRDTSYSLSCHPVQAA